MVKPKHRYWHQNDKGHDKVRDDTDNNNYIDDTLVEALELLNLTRYDVTDKKLRNIMKHANKRYNVGCVRRKAIVEACKELLDALLYDGLFPDVDEGVDNEILNMREDKIPNKNAEKRKRRKWRRNEEERNARRAKLEQRYQKRQKKYKKMEKHERKLKKMAETLEENIARLQSQMTKVNAQKKEEEIILRRHHCDRIRRRLERFSEKKEKYKREIEELEMRLNDSDDESSDSDDNADEDEEDDAISLTESDILFFEQIEKYRLYIYDDQVYNSDDDDGKKKSAGKMFPGGLRERDSLGKYRDVPKEYDDLHRILGYHMEQVDFSHSLKPIYDRLDYWVKDASFRHICEKFQTKVFVDWHFELKESSRPAMVGAKLANTWFVPKMGCWILRINFPYYYQLDDRIEQNISVTLKGKHFSDNSIQGRIEEVNPFRGCLYVSMDVHTVKANKSYLENGNFFDVYVESSMFTCTSALRAIDLAFRMDYESLLFPRIPVRNFRRGDSEIRSLSYEESTLLNDLQKRAVYEIARGEPKFPFVLFGPPGTGKTTVLVEAIHQILYEDPFARILICTPSGRASDVIAERLIYHRIIAPEFMFRLNSLYTRVTERSRRLDCISRLSNPKAAEENPAELAEGDFSRYFAGFEIPSLSVLKRYRIIIATLSASSYLVSGRMPRSHFTHIIIDEAGQCTEPEAWIPITGLAGKGTRVVLSGDPKQLGPISNFILADKLGCNTSMLERLSEHPAYKNNETLMITLQDCYRCHPAIIRLPSKLYYNGKLKAFREDSQDAMYRYLENWPGLPPKAKGFPIIFHDITMGYEDQTEKSSSYCNMLEVHKVCDYVREILHDKIVSESEIGIVSPYKLQTERLRTELKAYPHIIIDSVERFQGSEKRVIIMTTVRTGALGFLSHERRFNTAITRAQNLLIVVGNARALCQRKFWDEFISYCEERGGFRQD